MGRRFTAASNERIFCGSGGIAGLDYRYGTVAVVFNLVTATAAGTLVAVNGAASGAQCDIYCTSGPPVSVHYYDGTSDRTLATIVAGTTYLIVVTKATGTATPRYHLYNYTDRSWTHANGSGTCVDSGATTALSFGCYANGSNDPLTGELFAAGLWSRLVMGDGECERLARGDWLRQGPDFYRQWRRSDINLDMRTTHGRYKVRQTARTGSTQGTVAEPVGFRFAVETRRS